MLLAFHNDPSIKEKYIQRVKAHQLADEITKGIYWENGKGCAVGCTIHSSEHSAFEDELGIPRAIARLEDGIFEGLPNAEAKEFPLRFLSAVRVGADLSGVFDKFMHWLLVDETDGVIKFSKKPEHRKAIQDVADLFARRIAGEKIPLKDWQKASANAYASASDAAASANAAASASDASASASAYADAAAYASASASAASDAAASAYASAASDAAAYASASASAYADAAAADADAAASDARSRQANKLIELFESAPIPVNKAA